MRVWGRVLLCCLAWLLSSPVLAVEPDVETLSRDPQWLALLHMRRQATGFLRSEADEPSFFLSGQAGDPAAELRATLAALRQPETGERSAWCVFPARAAWLQKHVALARPAGLACAGLAQWREQFYLDRLVVVFPDMYMHHPASIFGHTFFRFDAADTTQHPVLLSTAMSYYAAVGTAGGTASYILNGLAGGFDGVFEVRPYFEKIRKYSDNEDRDIHEYELDLTPGQVSDLVDHAWEVRGHTFNYFFLDENCSYRLVALLDVVVPPHDMRLAFPLDAMPLDTVKVLEARGLVRARNYVPSAVRVFQAAYGRLDAEQQARLQAWARRDLPATALQEPAVREAAMQYAAIRLRQDRQHAPYYGDAFQTLLRAQMTDPAPARDQSDLAASESAADPARVSHGTRRAQWALESVDGDLAMRLGVRMAYHDERDPLPGFEPGARLEVMDLAWTLQDGEASLDHVTWFAVHSRKPQGVFFQPRSWGFSWSRRRELLGEDWTLVHALEGEQGVAIKCGEWLCHGELTGALLAGGAVDQGAAVGLGARFGATYQSTTWNLGLSLAHTEYLAGEHHALQALEADWTWRLQRDLAAGVSLATRDNGDDHRESVTIGLRYFF